MRIDICLPAHNEEVMLETSCRQLLEYCQNQSFPFDWRIVIIVNGSTDATAEIATKLAAESNRIMAVIKEEKGKGNAIINYWSESPADVLCFMDADLATNLNCLPDLLAPFAAHTDNLLIIGSRHLPYSRVARSWQRGLASRTYNILSRLFLNHHLTDLQCGFKAMSAKLFATVKPLIHDRGWFFDTELVTWSRRHGGAIIEIPVNWRETREGQGSKINLTRDSWRFITSLARLRKSIRTSRKTKDT